MKPRLPTILVFAIVTAATAAAAPTTDPQFREGPAVFGGPPARLDATTEPPPADEPGSANPLWAIPLNTLSITRERPLFLPSRRAPAPAVPSAAPVQIKPPAPVAAEPEKPDFSLVGVIAGSADGIAIFTSDTSRDVFRLRTGEAYNGWILRSVRGREAVLEKNQQNAILEIPSPASGMK